MLILASTIEYAPVKIVQIYFNTATYDEIKKDVKISLEAQLGLVGGTMGLFTGFSILSMVEIIYFVLRFFFSFKINKNVKAQKTQERLKL